MSEIINRVARALHRRDDGYDFDWNDITDSERRDYTEAARSALKEVHKHFVTLGEDGTSAYDFAVEELDAALRRS